VQIDEARAVLGVGPTASVDDVRGAYLRLIRGTHPDLAGGEPGATRRTARLTEAYAVLRRTVPVEVDVEVDERPAVSRLDQDCFTIEAPADEAFAALFEAAGRVGHIAYFDRNLGILETVVRFEGGPTCSVLLTLQGRAHGTEVFCTMESIEAAPTPPISPVIEAIVDELS
jgi:hypothetical protein